MDIVGHHLLGVFLNEIWYVYASFVLLTRKQQGLAEWWKSYKERNSFHFSWQFHHPCVLWLLVYITCNTLGGLYTEAGSSPLDMVGNELSSWQGWSFSFTSSLALSSLIEEKEEEELPPSLSLPLSSVSLGSFFTQLHITKTTCCQHLRFFEALESRVEWAEVVPDHKRNRIKVVCIPLEYY